MNKEKLLKQKIGARLSRIGLLSKVFAVQSFSKNELDITPEQFTVLMALKDNNGMYQRQLANLTLKDRPNITRIVQILEDNGYITSKIDVDGSRQVKKLYITQKGIDTCEKILPIIFDIWKATVSGIEDNEIDELIMTLEKIENNLRERTSFQI